MAEVVVAQGLSCFLTRLWPGRIRGRRGLFLTSNAGTELDRAAGAW